MKILVTKSRHQNTHDLPRIIDNEAATIPIKDFYVRYDKYDHQESIKEFDAIVFEISNEEEFQGSFTVIRETLEVHKIPYLYILNKKLSSAFKRVRRFFPDQMLVVPIDEETLRRSIHIFLLKLQQGYHIQAIEAVQKQKIWLSIKRGVYQSLMANEIRYVEAADHYLKIHSDLQNPIVIKSALREFHEKHLSKYRSFYFLSRSYIINIGKVNRIENNQLYIDSEIPLSIPKSKRLEVLEIVGIN